MPTTSAPASPASSRRLSRRGAMTAGLATLTGTAAHAAPVATQPAPASPTAARGPKKVAINRPDRKPNPLLSHCVRSGNLLFLAGIGGWYPEDRKEPGDAKVQTASALAAMRMILEAAGSSMANVLKVHMTIADPNRNLVLVNDAYRGQFPDPPPARSYSGCGVDQMGRDHVLVQIDCVAHVD
ncbi:MAG TPA: RidA family protein [Luteitalea sp.]|nr:RidA family protein [Luteitalea sp.]